ncbi:glycosyltransferase [Clostridium sp. NSJ-145]|uniref:glycosyltransferase n=1 Tax=Clostridium sp. NSJ-145 TaxID=2897777 RepID=UPI001E2C1C5A|nr:glycosyltransferase [Clostridium sp. NSJ-145]MCD2502897.1 glycosyltransferase [Clostridium sp. NSJ-145]
MKKKLLFMCINMNIGGTEKALLNMIAEIPNDKYEVTILMLEEYGGFLSEVPKWVKVEYLNKYSDIKPILNNPPQYTVREFTKNGQSIKALNIALIYYMSKILKNKNIFFEYILKDYSYVKQEFDLAVAYAGPMDFITYYVLNKITAKKKVQWIHFDIENIGFDKEFAKRNYKKFDKIFIVSEKGKDKLLKIVPCLKDKVQVFYNIISSKLVKEMADKNISFDDDFKGIKILAVGRLSEEKGQDLLIEAVNSLNKDGYNVKAYFVGDGPKKRDYENLINKFGLEEKCVLLGAKTNPYPFMKSCDIYMQPSRHEGYCITLAEARCFNAPIVTTNFIGSDEQIIDGETGLITNINSNDIYLAIKRLLDDKELMKNIKTNLENKDIEEYKEIDKLLNLF